MNEGYIYQIMVMAAYLWPEGLQVQKDPAAYIRTFIEKNYNQQTAVDGIAVLTTLRSQNKMLADNGRKDAIYAKLLNAGVCFASNSYEKSMGLLAFFIGLTYEIWGMRFDQTVKEKLYTIAGFLRLNKEEVDILINLTKQEELNPREAALKILGLPSNANRDDIKSAYRRLSLKYHPDRNLDKSGTEKEESERKFKEIVAAKQLLDSL